MCTVKGIMATNDNKITTTTCAVGILRDGGAAEVLMMIACSSGCAECTTGAMAMVHSCHCPSSPLFGFLWEEEGRRR